MRILGIDPGYDRCGVAVLDKVDGKESLLLSGCITTDKNVPFEHRLVTVTKELANLVETHKPAICALEQLYFTTNKKTAMRVAEVRGAIVAMMCERGITIRECGPGQVKVAITGDGRATKRQMIMMVPKLISMSKTVQYDDEYDAIAIALTVSAYIRTQHSDI
jgi:crossover junction endodeoxyribonuclease RuvC